jgi:hypothetical protein
MLKTVTQITGQFPATFFTGFLALLIQSAFAVFLTLTAAGWGFLLFKKSVSREGAIAVLLFLLFSFYWTTQIISNVVHVTVSGLVATFYFFASPDSNSNGKFVIPNIKNPTVKAAKRALTTSFGSICYGSLKGKPFCEAGKDTWRLLKNHGIDAIINDDLIGSVMGIGTILTGVISGAFGGIYLKFGSTVYQEDVVAIFVVSACIFLIS